MKTFSIRAPFNTHWRKCTCEEFGCVAWRNGWRIHCEAISRELLQAATHSGRHYTVVKIVEGETYLEFSAGQPCFVSDTHKIRLDRQEIYVARSWRGLPSNGRNTKHTPESWLDDFSTNQDKLNSIINH